MGSQVTKLTHHNAFTVCFAAVRLLHDAPAAAGSSSDSQAGRISSSHSQGDGVQWPGGVQRHQRPAAAVLLEAARLQHAEVSDTHQPGGWCVHADWCGGCFGA